MHESYTSQNFIILICFNKILINIDQGLLPTNFYVIYFTPMTEFCLKMRKVVFL